MVGHVLWLNRTDFEESSEPIPIKEHFQELSYPFSVFVTSSVDTFLYNLAAQILSQFAIILPDQAQALSIQGAFYDVVSICNFPKIIKSNLKVIHIGSGFGSFVRILTSHFIGKKQLDLAKSIFKKSNVYIMIIGAFCSLIMCFLRNSLANLFFGNQPEWRDTFATCLFVAIALIPFIQAIDAIISFFW